MNGDELKRRRGELGMTQSQLARALDVPVNTVWRWELQDDAPAAVGIRHGRILELALQTLERERERERDDRDG